MKRTLALFSLVLLNAAVAGAMDVKTRHQPGTDFSRYSTYAWKGSNFAADHPLAEGSPLDRRIRAAGDAELTASGLVPAREGEPDLWVTYVGFVEDALKIEGTRQQISEGVAWVGNIYTDSTIAYKEGTLVFEIRDAGSGELVWSGWASEVARTSDKLRKKAEKVVRRILRRFPPD